MQMPLISVDLQVENGFYATGLVLIFCLWFMCGRNTIRAALGHTEKLRGSSKQRWRHQRRFREEQLPSQVFLVGRAVVGDSGDSCHTLYPRWSQGHLLFICVNALYPSS